MDCARGLQLDKSDSDSPRYQALGAVKSVLNEALDLLKWRLDLIGKVDDSKVGWPAALIYERANGMSLKEDSNKLWLEAERKAADSKKSVAVMKDSQSYKSPFRGQPAAGGRAYSSYQKPERGR